MRLTDRTFFTLAIFVVVLTFVLLSTGYQPKARLVPLAIGIPTLLLALFQLLIDMVPAVSRRFRFLEQYDVFGIESERVPQGSGQSDEQATPKTIHQRELRFAAWLLLLMALIYFLGYLTAIALFMPLFLRFRSSEGWRMTLAITAGTWIFVYVVFILVMRAPLHEGVLWPSLGL